MAEDISTLVLSVKSDGIKEGTNQLDALTKAADKAEASTKKLGTATAAANVENKSATATAQAQVNAINSVTAATQKSAVASAQAAIQRKRDIETAKDSQVAYMQAQEDAIKMNNKITDSLNNVTKGHGSNSAAIRESMVLMHELSQGQMKRLGGSLLVLANQLDVIPKLLSAISTSGAGTVATLGLIYGALAGMIALVAAIPIAYAAGAAEQRKLSLAIEETGNFAGVTTGQMSSMAKEATKAGGSIGVATNAVTGLVASGKFAGDSIGLMAEAIEKTTRVSHEAGDQLQKDFESIATVAVTSTTKSHEAITRHLIELNDHYHLLTAAQIEEVAALDRIGKSQEAIALSAKMLAEEQIKRADESISKLGFVAKAWQNIGSAIGGAWQAAKDFGRTDPEAMLKQAKSQLADLKRGGRQGGEQVYVSPAQIALAEQAVVAAQKAVDDAQTKAIKEGEKQRDEAYKSHASERVRTIIAAEDKQFAAKQKLAEFDADWTETSEKTKTELAVGHEIARAKLVAEAAGIKADKSGDEGKLRRDQRVSDLEMEKKDNLEALEEMLNTSKALGEEDTRTRQAQLEDRHAIYEAERINIQVSYEKELQALNDYHGKTRAAMEDNERKKSEIRNAAKAAQGNLDKRENADANSITKREIKDQEELAKRVQTTGDAETKRLQGELDAEGLRLEGLGKTKSAVMELKLARDLAASTEIEQSNQQLELDILDAAVSGEASLSDIQLMNTRLALGKKHLEQRGLLAKTFTDQIALQKKAEEQDRTTKNLDEALASAKRFQKGMQEAFGTIGKGIGDMAVAFVQLGKDQNTAQIRYNDSIKAGVDAKQAEMTLNQDNAQALLTGYGSAAEAAKGMFAANSRGYQAMAAVSKVFHVAEAAMQAARMIQLGITAVLTQAQGDPYTAFARMAAMAAVVVGLGVAIKGGGSGGGQSAADVQKSQGTGSVFGDATAKSAAISKSLDLIQNNTGILIPINNAMLDSLRAIQASMVGLANLIVRVPGLTAGTNMGIQTGQLNSKGSSTDLISGVLTRVTDALLGPIVGGKLAAIANNLWGKVTQNIVDTGIQFQGVVSNLQSGKGFEQYASVDTTKSSWFGLSKSTSNRVETQGLGDELNQQFGLIFTNIEDVLKAAAPALGKSSEEVGKAVENFTIPLTKLSLKDLKGDDLTNAINGVISKALDDIAKAAFPGYEKFAQVGEGYSQTLVRVANDVLNVQQVFALLGKTLDITKTNSADITEALIAAAGGLDKLQSGTKAFTDAFYTDAEKLAPLQLAVQQRMSELGVNAVTTADQFKALVLAQDLTTAAGQDMYLKLLDIAPAFKQVIDAQDKAAQAAQDAAQAAQDAADKITKAAQDAATAAEALAQTIRDTLQKAFEDAMGGVNSAYSALQASVGKQKDDVTARLTLEKNALTKKQDLENSAADTAHKTVLDNISVQGKAQLAASKAYYDALKKVNTDDLAAAKDKVNIAQKLLDSIKTSLDATAQYDLAEAHAKALGTVQAAAQSSNAAGFAGIDDAIKELAKPTEDLFSSLVEYQSSQAQANNALQSLQDAGVSQLTDAQKQLDALMALKDALDVSSQAATDATQTQTQTQQDAENVRYEAEKADLTARHQEEQSALQAYYDAQLKALDDLLSTTQRQIDALTGIDTSIQSLGVALSSFMAAVSAANIAKNAAAAGGVTVGTLPPPSTQTTSGFVESLYETILGRKGEAGGMDFWTGVLNKGAASQAEVVSSFFNSAEYKSMHPSLAVGTNEVPEDMMANIHKGERIIPAADNAELMRRIKSDDAEPSADMVTMNTKLDNLTDVIMRGDVANVQKTNDMYRIFRDWDGNGMPPVRS